MRFDEEEEQKGLRLYFCSMILEKVKADWISWSQNRNHKNMVISMAQDIIY